MEAYKFSDTWVRNMAPEEIRTYAPERGLSDKAMEAFQIELDEMYDEGYYNASEHHGDTLTAECDWWYDKGRVDALDEIEEKTEEVISRSDYDKGYAVGHTDGEADVCRKVMAVL